MLRTIELIRNSQVPAHVMQAAARGSLALPPEEMLEILVYLALHHKLLGQQARLTLAGWDEKVCLAVAADPRTSAEVLGYWASVENLRMPLLPLLVNNPSVPEHALHKLAGQGGRLALEVLLASPRVAGSPALLNTLRSNANLRPNELAEVQRKLGAFKTAATAPSAMGEVEAPSDVAHEVASDVPEEVVEEALTRYLKDNAAELEKEKEDSFRAVSDLSENSMAVAAKTETEEAAETVEAGGQSPGGPPMSLATFRSKQAAAARGGVEKRDSTLQKIGKLDIKGRISLAMRGNKEERSILIRDSVKLVCLAVLDSPKLSEREVEGFAMQKNVLDSVLRTIPMKRRFAKNYTVTRNLVYNPRTPVDASLPLMKQLLKQDLKNLMGNKEVPDTVRKLAARLFAQKQVRQQ